MRSGQFRDCRNGRGAYGGVWTENIVSGIARDLLVEAMFRVEAAGYPVVLHVHDELVCEVPIGFGSEEEFIDLMTRKPAWAGICRSQPVPGVDRGTASEGEFMKNVNLSRLRMIWPDILPPARWRR